jgi:ABC-type sugar transport system substrate-binding protein
MAKSILICCVTVVALSGCGTFINSNLAPSSKAVRHPSDSPELKPESNGTGPKIAYIVRDPGDPWVNREVTAAKAEARRDGVRFSLFVTKRDESLTTVLTGANVRSAAGVILASPQPGDRKLIERSSRLHDFKLIAIDDQSRSTGGKKNEKYSLNYDYKSSGEIALRAMIKEAERRQWDLQTSGMVLTTGASTSQADQAEYVEIKGLMKAGLPKRNIFVVPLPAVNLRTSRTSTLEILKNESPIVSNWFVAGANDFAVVGGLRAAERLNVGHDHVIGVGLGGDGAIYDLQRPRKSTLIGSVLLPADLVGTIAVKEMVKWIESSRPPKENLVFEGVFLDRKNVRDYKISNQVVE